MAYLVISEQDKEPYRHELKGPTTFGRARETAHLPQPMPRAREAPSREQRTPSPTRVLSPSDTTLDASRVMDGSQAYPFPRPLPHWEDPEAPRQQTEGRRKRAVLVLGAI